MMLDADVVAVSPASVYRVLSQAGLLRPWAPPPSQKGRGFHQPEAAHQHWHVDIAYLNIAGTFFFLCSVLDGYSRFILHWEIRPQMTPADVEIVLQRACEAFPEAQPRIISDNGPQFIAREFKEFVRVMGMTHVRTSPFYPQSNGKLERWHHSLKEEAVRPKTPLRLEDAQRVVPLREPWRGRMLNLALGVLDEILAEFSGDPERVCLTGVSMGGYGTWRLALEQPQRFAALAPVCGGLDTSARRPLARQLGYSREIAAPFLEAARTLQHLPIWVFHGSADPIIPVSESQVMVEALEQVGAKVRYTEYSGIGHDSWDPAYDEPDLPRWLLAGGSLPVATSAPRRQRK